MSTNENLEAHRQSVFTFYGVLLDAGFSPRLRGLEVEVMVANPMWVTDLWSIEKLAEQYCRQALLVSGDTPYVKFFPRIDT